MVGMYAAHKCRTCGREFVLLSEDINVMAKDRYLVCPYCNSKRVGVDKVSDSVKDCMNEHSYKRCKGAIQQKR
jgi:DNA-directed RNA polymerase subunit RPC12/RpoP